MYKRQLGNCYYDGKGVEQDYETAVEWYEKAAEQGDMSAQEKLIQCYRNGKGVEKDERKAVEWISRLNDQQYKTVSYTHLSGNLSGQGILFSRRVSRGLDGFLPGTKGERLSAAA